MTNSEEPKVMGTINLCISNKD